MLFEEAFRVFWRPPPEGWSMDDLRALGEQRRFGTPQVSVPPGDASGIDDPAVATLAESGVDRVDPFSSAPLEVSRVKDFEQFTEEELARAREMIAALSWDPGMRLTRRWVAGRGNTLDLRRLIRRNMRHGGELLLLPTRGRTMTRAPAGPHLRRERIDGTLFPHAAPLHA